MSEEFRDLKARAIHARMQRDEAKRILALEEMHAIFRFLDEQNMPYEALGKNEELRTLQRLRLLENDPQYEEARALARSVEQVYLEAEADVEAYQEGRRLQRDELWRAAIAAGIGERP